MQPPVQFLKHHLAAVRNQKQNLIKQMSQGGGGVICVVCIFSEPGCLGKIHNPRKKEIWIIVEPAYSVFWHRNGVREVK